MCVCVCVRGCFHFHLLLDDEWWKLDLVSVFWGGKLQNSIGLTVWWWFWCGRRWWCSKNRSKIFIYSSQGRACEAKIENYRKNSIWLNDVLHTIQTIYSAAIRSWRWLKMRRFFDTGGTLVYGGRGEWSGWGRGMGSEGMMSIRQWCGDKKIKQFWTLHNKLQNAHGHTQARVGSFISSSSFFFPLLLFLYAGFSNWSNVVTVSAHENRFALSDSRFVFRFRLRLVWQYFTLVFVERVREIKSFPSMQCYSSQTECK